MRPLLAVPHLRSLGLAVVLILTLACNLPRFPPAWPPRSSTSTGVPAEETDSKPFPTPPLLALPSQPQITSLQMLDCQRGWALSRQAVLYTADGGTTWQDVTPSGLDTLNTSVRLIARDASQAWLLVPSDDFTRGVLYRTTDGGKHWVIFPVPFGVADIDFPDARRGWAMADLGAGAGSMAVAIFTSNDGGKTWTQVYIHDPSQAGSSDTLPLSGIKSGLSALDSYRAWVSGSMPVEGFVYLYRSENGGRTWSQQIFSLPAGYAMAQTTSYPPRFFGSDAVLPVVLYADEINIVFYLSGDRGQSWEATLPVPGRGVFAIASARDFWVWDGRSRMYLTHDGGVSWEVQETQLDLGEMLVALQFVDRSCGWAQASDAEEHRSLYRTLDGGRTWTTLIP